MSIRALVITITVIILVGTIGLTAVYVRNEAAKAKADVEMNGGPTNGRDGESDAPRPLLEVDEFTLEHHEQGHAAWKVRLSNLAVETGGRTVSAGGLKEGIIYGKDGKPAVRVTAERVNYDTISYDFDMTGKVRVVSPKGAVITTDKVHWDNKSRSLTTPGRIILRTTDRITVTTAGMKFDTDAQTVYAPNQVRLETGKSNCIGKNLTYPLDSNRFTLDNVQMVVDVDEARERTER